MSAAKPEKDLRSLNATAKEIQRFAENTRKTDSCWHYCSVTVHGYGRMYLSGISVHAHRFALILHSGLPSSPAQMARHKCVNKDCVRPSHLEWGSARDNVLDRYRDGTMRAPRKGSQHSWAVLNEAQVLEIYEAYAKGRVSMSSIAKRYAVHFSTVNAIVKRDNWADVTAHLPDINLDRNMRGNARGSKNRNAKLDESKVKAIKQALAQNHSYSNCRILAERYDVAPSAIYKISRGHSWQHVSV